MFRRFKFLGRILKYVLIGTALMLLEAGVFTHLPIFNGRPNLMLPYAMLVAILDDTRAGAVIGLLGGFFSDALFTSPLLLSPILYSVCAYATGAVVNYFFSVNMISAMLTLLLALGLRGVFELFHLLATWGSVNVVLAIFQVILPGVVYSLALAVPIYFLAGIGRKRSSKRDIYLNQLK